MPYNEIPQKILIDGLIEYQQLDRAFVHLMRLERSIPSAYSAKWIGTYYLVHNDYPLAGKYLEQSIVRSDQDPQTFYNLAGVYINEGSFQEALDMVDRCLELAPDFEGAAKTRADLEKAVESVGGKKRKKAKGKRLKDELGRGVACPFETLN